MDKVAFDFAHRLIGWWKEPAASPDMTELLMRLNFRHEVFGKSLLAQDYEIFASPERVSTPQVVREPPLVRITVRFVEPVAQLLCEIGWDVEFEGDTPVDIVERETVTLGKPENNETTGK